MYFFKNHSLDWILETTIIHSRSSWVCHLTSSWSLSSLLLSLGLRQKIVTGKYGWHCCCSWVGPSETDMKSIQIMISRSIPSSSLSFSSCLWICPSSFVYVGDLTVPLLKSAGITLFWLPLLWLPLAKVLALQLCHETLCLFFCLHCCCWPLPQHYQSSV